jgi:hypothetical protein
VLTLYIQSNCNMNSCTTCWSSTGVLNVLQKVWSNCEESHMKLQNHGSPWWLVGGRKWLSLASCWPHPYTGCLDFKGNSQKQWLGSDSGWSRRFFPLGCNWWLDLCNVSQGADSLPSAHVWFFMPPYQNQISWSFNHIISQTSHESPQLLMAHIVSWDIAIFRCRCAQYKTWQCVGPYICRNPLEPQ